MADGIEIVRIIDMDEMPKAVRSTLASHKVVEFMTIKSAALPVKLPSKTFDIENIVVSDKGSGETQPSVVTTSEPYDKAEIDRLYAAGTFKPIVDRWPSDS
jgi:hypothetical protein